MIKEISIIVLMLIAQFKLSAQVESFDNLVSEWTQGEVDKNGNVVQAEVNMAGWYSLDISKNNSVTFRDPFSCGFGRKRDGNWVLNKEDKTITFKFTKTTGYMNNKGIKKIDEEEVYKIEKLTEDEFIIRLVNSERDRYYLFTKNSA